MFAEFSPKWRSRSSHLRGGSYNRTVVPKTLPDAARSSADAAHLGQLGGEDLGREDLWWRVEESSSIDQQAREERALQVRLAFAVGRKRIDDPEGGHVGAQREPGDGALLLVGKPDGVGE
jgi:hypothetical protein